MKIQAIRVGRNRIVAPFSHGGVDIEPGQPVTLLVHGYNNDEYEAADSFYTMRRNLDEVLRFAGAGEAQRKLIQQRIWECYWPGFPSWGNSRIRRRSKWESSFAALSYSMQVWKARSWVPDRLAEYLRRRRPSEVFFVAHSLGCRVVLETINRLTPQSVPALSGFLLMAGAVPVDHLKTGGLSRSTRRVWGRKYCLHSRVDLVLLAAFPPGQILSGEAPLIGEPEAVGLRGAPGDLWDLSGATGLGHSDYWERGIFKHKPGLAEICAGITGVGTSRHLPLNELTELPEARVYSLLPENQIATGKLPGAEWLEDGYAPRDL